MEAFRQKEGLGASFPTIPDKKGTKTQTEEMPSETRGLFLARYPLWGKQVSFPTIPDKKGTKTLMLRLLMKKYVTLSKIVKGLFTQAKFEVLEFLHKRQC